MGPQRGDAQFVAGGRKKKMQTCTLNTGHCSRACATSVQCWAHMRTCTHHACSGRESFAQRHCLLAAWRGREVGMLCFLVGATSGANAHKHPRQATSPASQCKAGYPSHGAAKTVVERRKSSFTTCGHYNCQTHHFGKQGTENQPPTGTRLPHEQDEANWSWL